MFVTNWIIIFSLHKITIQIKNLHPKNKERVFKQIVYWTHTEACGLRRIWWLAEKAVHISTLSEEYDPGMSYNRKSVGNRTLENMNIATLYLTSTLENYMTNVKYFINTFLNTAVIDPKNMRPHHIVVYFLHANPVYYFQVPEVKERILSFRIYFRHWTY